jgi:hypothetical protein
MDYYLLTTVVVMSPASFVVVSAVGVVGLVRMVHVPVTVVDGTDVDELSRPLLIADSTEPRCW